MTTPTCYLIFLICYWFLFVCLFVYLLVLVCILVSLCLRVYDSGCDFFFLHQCDNTKITLLQLIISSAFRMKFSSLVPNCASAILWFVLCQLSHLYSTFVELTNRFCYI